MNTTTKKAPPTEEEVMAALLRETVRETNTGGDTSRKDWSPANQIDVADRIARMRGWDGSKGYATTSAGYNPTRARVIGQLVSIKAVQEILDRLYSEGRVHAFFGSHRVISAQYGVNPRSTYYLTDEALDLLVAQKRRQWLERSEIDALDAARQKVLDEHADAVERYRSANLAALLPQEPDFRTWMLADDTEASDQ